MKKKTISKSTESSTPLYSISINDDQYAGFFLDTSSGKQSITINDTDAVLVPNYDALIAFRSNRATILFPNLSNTAMEELTTPAAGMVLFNVEHDRLYVYTQNKGFIPVGGQNDDPNPVFETITCTKDGSLLKDTVIDGELTTQLISCDGEGSFDYLKSNAVSVVGSVVAGSFITKSGLVADGTVSGGTLISKGDITSGSDVSGMRLNLLVNGHSLTLEGNIAQASDMTLIFPANNGKVNQVLSTDGNGNLNWINNEIIITSTVGKDILNGTDGVIIKTSAVTMNSIISVTRNMGAGLPPSVITIGNLTVGSIIEHTSFVVYSTTHGDVENFDWLIINP